MCNKNSKYLLIYKKTEIGGYGMQCMITQQLNIHVVVSANLLETYLKNVITASYVT